MPCLMKQQVGVVQAKDKTGFAGKQKPKKGRQPNKESRQLQSCDFSPGTRFHASLSGNFMAIRKYGDGPATFPLPSAAAHFAITIEPAHCWIRCLIVQPSIVLITDCSSGRTD